VAATDLVDFIQASQIIPQSKPLNGLDIEDFFRSSCIIDSQGMTSAQELFQAFLVWFKTSAFPPGIKPLSARGFGLALRERGFRPARAGGGSRFWCGLVLRVRE
jgi:hypothetical protein